VRGLGGLVKKFGFHCHLSATLELAVFQNTLGGNSPSIIATHPEIDTSRQNRDALFKNNKAFVRVRHLHSERCRQHSKKQPILGWNKSVTSHITSTQYFFDPLYIM